jgi:hypothetical protein
MRALVLTPHEIAALRERRVDPAAMNRRVAWRGGDEMYVSRLREIYGLPGDLCDIAIARFPNRLVVVTVNGPSGGLLLAFIPDSPDGSLRVESTFFSPNGAWPAALMLDVDVQPVIDATEELFRRLASRQGGVQ